MADKNINENDLEKVSGGAIFKDFDDDTYNSAGVEITGPGSAYGEGFWFKGERIQRDEAGIIVDFYHFFGRQPGSSEEAMDWYRNSLDY